MRLKPAPEWDVSQWFNTPRALQLSDFLGRVVVLHAFQMLCPGCVSLALPQAQRFHTSFSSDEVAVVGLHSVFEHHAEMQPDALAAFIHELRFSFPIGIDRHEAGARMPNTMQSYHLQGTPSTVLIDRDGKLRLARLGHVDSSELKKMIGVLLGEGLSLLSHEGEDQGLVCTPEVGGGALKS